MSALNLLRAAFDGRAPIAALMSRYSEPWRHYHVWAHPMAMLDHLILADRDGVTIHEPTACVGFIAWHDSVYDPRAPRGRNEELSAELCAAEMIEISSSRSTSIACSAIRATIGHDVPPLADYPDAALLLDIDLSILGSAPDIFALYDQQIRLEYAHVAEADYRAARAGVLRSFLKRQRIYLTDWGHTQWDAAARHNLGAAITALEA